MQTSDASKRSSASAEPARRTLLRAAAWSTPVFAAAVAAPLATASDVIVGDFAIEGTCGTVGELGPGFTLTASPTVALPVGTSFLIVGSGVTNVGVFTLTGGAATVSNLGGQVRMVELTAALSAGQTLAVRSTLSLSVTFTIIAFVTLPDGFQAGPDAKEAASVTSTSSICVGT